MILNIFLNAETKHDRSTEQEIVHKCDLTGNYKTAFNLGKQDEVEHRVKHGGKREWAQIKPGTTKKNT